MACRGGGSPPHVSRQPPQLVMCYIFGGRAGFPNMGLSTTDCPLPQKLHRPPQKPCSLLVIACVQDLKKGLSQVLSKREAQCGSAMTRSDTFVMPSISPSLPVQTRFSSPPSLSCSCNINTSWIPSSFCPSITLITHLPPLQQC